MFELFPLDRLYVCALIYLVTLALGRVVLAPVTTPTNSLPLSL